MNHRDFSTSFLADASPHEVFDAINNPRAWWSEKIKGDTSTLNSEFIFEVKGVHYSKHRLVELIPEKKVVWLTTASELSFLRHKSEWTGTRIIFDISRESDTTKLVFTHEGLTPGVECYDTCTPAWIQYIQHSLFNLVTTGKGDPSLEGRTIKPIEIES